MGFYNVLKQLETIDFQSYFENVSDQDVLKSIDKEKLNYKDLLNLISPKAQNHVEKMAQKAHKLTLQFFGRTIGLYLPIYIANYCTNDCIYCGFSKRNKIERKKLTLEEIEKEAIEISKTEVKHILFLTGEAQELTPIEYLNDAVKILRKYFSSVSIEIFPMDVEEYKILKDSGVDGLTVYQEVYNEEIYDKVHLSGKKKDFLYRLNTPERGAKAGIRSIGMGTLYGLGDIKKEAFFSAMHAKYLMDKYLDSEFSLSLPRINDAEGGFKPYEILDDATFIQFMLAFRIFLPRVGINISTRERAEFRDNLLPLGVTKFSAGSKTDVGGYTLKDKSTPQFEISDDRDVKEMVKMIKSKNYQPVYKDWETI